MPIRFDQIPFRIDQLRIDQLRIDRVSVGGHGSARGLWLGSITSGVTHLAGGLLLGAFWGTALVQLVPPPSGANAIQLTASQVVALEATLHDEFETATPLPPVRLEATNESADHVPQPSRQLRPEVGEMPPAPVIVDLNGQTDVMAATGQESSAAPPPSTRRSKPPRAAARQTEPPPPRTVKQETAAPPPVASTASVASALPSTRQQGQEADSPPRKFHSPAPVYPAAAFRQGITGRVVLRVRVAADGTVTAASVLRTSGHAILDAAALEGVQRRRFQPARQLGLAVEKEIAVPITFRIVRSR